VNLLKLMTDRNRFDVLPFLTRQYRDLVDLRVGRVRGQITSARALDEAQVRGIKLSLESMTQRSVVLESSVDASLLGGVVAQVGSKVYDGSLKAQLKDLSQALSRPVR
jgi:F-type H+-transporting ATPase subunit delta